MEAERAVVGRRAELEATLRLLERSRDGLRALVLTGAPGVGKTTVWRRGLELAADAGFAVLRARPTGAEARLSYAALADLLAGDRQGELLEGLPRVQRRALEVALLRRGAGPSPVDARAVGTGLLSVLRALAAAGPVLLAVDDAQWLDAPSSAALTFALRRLEDAPAAVLATVRVEAERPSAFVDAIPGGACDELPLGPLSVASLHAIIRGELGWAPPRPVLVKLAAAAGGNAFYALEVARELRRVGAAPPAGPLPVPTEVRRLLRRRLERLPPRTRSALLAASCLAAPTAELVGAGALAPAEEAGIVRVAADGGLEFAHPLLAAAVYEAAPAARRRAAHRRLAERVGDAEERARHLALACAARDAGVAGELDAAATLARARGAPAAAAELAELALRLSPERGRGVRLLSAAACHFDAGDLDRAQALLDRAVAETPDGPPRAAALRLLGQLRARHGSYAEAARLAREALGPGRLEPELDVGLQLDLVYYLTMSGDLAAAVIRADEAVGGAERVGSAPLLASALAVRAVTWFMGGRGFRRADVERALALDEPLPGTPLIFRPRFAQGLLLLWSGRVHDAFPVLEAVRRELVEQGRESDVPMVSLYLVWACVWAGELERAEPIAAEARRTAALLDDRVADAITLAAAALAHACRGRADLARTEAVQSVELFHELRSPPGTIWGCWALGLLELSLGDPAAVDAVLGPLAGATAALGPIDPVLVMFVPDEVEALVELGRLDQARSLLDPFEAQARALDRTWAIAAAARGRGLLAAADGDLEGAVAALDDALARHEDELPLERARTLFELGRVERRRRHRRLARLALEEALAVFARSGAEPWAERTRAELARVATRRAPSALTSTEERIARFAAEGLTNRQVAERAFVAVTTVEANLKRAYRKLGITSRAQLARALDEPGRAPIS